MASSASLAMSLTVTEEIANNTDSLSATARSVTHNAFNVSETLPRSASPAVPFTSTAFFKKALSSGAATIDLTSLTGTNGKTVDLTGLKVQAILLRNPSTNANPITVGEGATNGYELAGNAWSVQLKPGMSCMIYAAEQAPDVGSSAKTIDLAGTGSQALDVGIVAG